MSGAGDRHRGGLPSRACNGLGLVPFIQGDRAAAEAQYRRALQANPDDPVARDGLDRVTNAKAVLEKRQALRQTRPMSASEAIALAAAAAAAGGVNAVAGGGTLITFPALILWGTPPIIANATSTLALVFGTTGSVYGYRRQIAAVKPWLGRFVPVSLLGGLLGGILLTRTREDLFAKMVPFLLLFATILFVLHGAFRRFAGFGSKSETAVTPHHHAVWAAVGFQFLVALYGGYFGAGIGILMLASLGFIGLTNIHEMNGLKTVLGLLINVVAAIYFVFAGLIDWPRTAVMTAGALAGYSFGSHYAQRIPQRRVRHIITTVGFLISAAMFYEQFR